MNQQDKENGSKKIIQIGGLKEYAQTMGPGIVTGSSGNDPSGIATYSQVGARFGYHQLWLAVISFPLQAAVQEICARIGMVTGVGLTTVIKQNYAKSIALSAVIFLTIANIITLGADIGAMTEATRLIMPHIPFVAALGGFIVISLLLQIFLEYKTYANYLTFLTFTLLAYIATAVIVKQNWHEVIHFSLVPYIQFNKDYIFSLVAVLGTTITPYMYFWQTSQEVEEMLKMGMSHEERKGTTGRALRLMRFDVIFGMFFSNVIMWFIILTAAGTLASHGITTINSAPEAALALKPFAGDAAYILFALGIIGAGLLAVPILAGSSAYAISELMGWKHGLYLKLNQGYTFYGLIIACVLLGSLVNLIGINPIKMLIYAAVINGIIAGPLVFLIIQISSNKKIMGSRASGLTAKALGYFTAAFLCVSAVLLLLTFIKVL